MKLYTKAEKEVLIEDSYYDRHSNYLKYNLDILNSLHKHKYKLVKNVEAFTRSTNDNNRIEFNNIHIISSAQSNFDRIANANEPICQMRGNLYVCDDIGFMTSGFLSQKELYIYFPLSVTPRGAISQYFIINYNKLQQMFIREGDSRHILGMDCFMPRFLIRRKDV